MSNDSKDRTRVYTGVTITLSVRASDEATAKRVLAHPTLRDLVEKLGARTELAGQDRLEEKEKPFTAYTEGEFRYDVMLRARAVKWLVEQLMLPEDHKNKIVVGRIAKKDDLTTDNLLDNLPNLERALINLVSELEDSEGQALFHELTLNHGYDVLNNPKLANSYSDRIREAIATAKVELGQDYPNFQNDLLDLSVLKIALIEAELE